MRLNAPSLTYLVSSLPHASVSLRSFAPTEDNEGESRPVSLRFLLDPRLHSRPPNLQKSSLLTSLRALVAAASSDTWRRRQTGC